MWKSPTNQSTSTNDDPLTNRGRFGTGAAEESSSVQAPGLSLSHEGKVNPRDASDGSDLISRFSRTSVSNGERRTRSRWGDPTPENQAAAISPVNAPQVLLQESLPQSTTGSLDPRSPPLPLAHDEHSLKIDDSRKRSSRPMDKVYIPVVEFPQINFFGLLVGPRGNTLKRMERESGAKISIRGKGSVKVGKAPDRFMSNAEEDLYCLVTADCVEKVTACVKLINHVIETATSTPEGQNHHKRCQLKELAVLNGTLRDVENQICQHCGVTGHCKYECPKLQQNFATRIICRLCGSAGHMARYCSMNGEANSFVLAGGIASSRDMEHIDTQATRSPATIADSNGIANDLSCTEDSVTLDSFGSMLQQTRDSEGEYHGLDEGRRHPPDFQDNLPRDASVSNVQKRQEISSQQH